ncbi:hypothetical protein SAMN04488066_101148 [Halorubrum aquaticum]|uniref:Uncharacterized protein n=1 Tax=Halorubrum aquaticum TaxID=387340 RepID=A0A1I2Z269_9EURY|nr:hypothetical protein SAMN04488066_101148 [Halorubrum aquaticum]
MTSDRTAAPIGAESTSRRGGREDASFRLGARRDGVSGDGER